MFNISQADHNVSTQDCLDTDEATVELIEQTENEKAQDFLFLPQLILLRLRQGLPRHTTPFCTDLSLTILTNNAQKVILLV